ncbi:hypothetical protein [Desertivirga arenae]|uniref:hypothetical protein n=1 Tax=Desertivirga arenae TaxID=2810309 RepID=UPI001A9633BA|nr:hypothetical protein [Pedobacter sp. SYSU D00823]
MKTLIITLTASLILSVSSFAQSKKDSLKLRADLDAIRQGKQVKSGKTKSVVRANTPVAKVDTGAIKSGTPTPITPTPNNPNPHDPRPSVINPNSSTTPPENPTVPPGSPKGPEFDPNKKKE